MTASNFLTEAARIVRAAAGPCVYPAYVIWRAQRGLLAAKDASDEILADIGEIQTVRGGSAYQLTVTDTYGTRYRLTVEVADG